MKTIFTMFILLSSLLASAQTTIKGKVTDKHGTPIPGVNVFVENTFDGTSSDGDGNFSFTTSQSGTQNLVASFIGFKTWTQTVDLSENITVNVELIESVNTIDAVTITAGSFAADDESRASVMKPLDIYTTPSANGDVMGAIKTMPGTQASADDGRLLVRGGDAYETATYIDGLVASKPYYSKTPDIATRGRFSPSLFSGVQFSTGGYSAEYGQALSSVLALNSNDIAEKDVTGLSIMSLGVEASHTERWEKSSASVSGSYTNFKGYDKIFNNNIDWEKPVESGNSTFIFRQKTNSSGLFKAYLTADYGDLAYRVPTGSDGESFRIGNRGSNVYSNLSYRDCFSDKSCYKVGVSTTWEDNNLDINTQDIDTKELTVETRFSVVHDLSEGVKLTWGANETFTKYEQNYQNLQATKYTMDFNDNLIGFFAEPEIKFTKNFAIRPGIRSEYASVIGKWNVAPRVALAWKTGETAQLSGAWGKYHQTPQADYLKLNTNLDFEKATHYILSYQIGDVSKRLFRAEAYHKTYDDLITFDKGEYGIAENITNSGDGYATGFDVFWRDQKSIKGFDYWLTYSFVDTERKYKDYPEKVTPYFISKHNFSLVGKYWINKINTQVGASYSIASGRPYNDPATSTFNDKKTGTYSDLSLNFSHIFYLGNQYSVLYCSVNNVLGNNNILSYRTSSTQSPQDNATLVPVKRNIKRMVFLGLFLNF